MRRLPFDAVVLAGIGGASAATLFNAYFDTQVGDSDIALAVKAPKTQQHLTTDVVNELNAEGVVVIRNVLSAQELKAARQSIDAIVKEGRFEESANYSSLFRLDTTCWLRESDGTSSAVAGSRDVNAVGAGLMYCLSLLRGTAAALDDLGYNRSSSHMVPSQCQLSRYTPPPTADGPTEGRTGYVAHRDASDDDLFDVGLLGWLKSQDYRRRSITAILYLNKSNWNCNADADGGALKLYVNANSSDVTGASATDVRHVSPAGGTLVLFDSRYLLHEVAPTNADRYALTVWIGGEKTENSGISPLSKLALNESTDSL